MSAFVVFSTTKDARSARKIARVLVGKKLAACVSYQGGWKSVYRWKHKIEATGEVLILVKTTSAKLKTLQKTLREIHPYEIPEILALPAKGGDAGYLRWLREALK